MSRQFCQVHRIEMGGTGDVSLALLAVISWEEWDDSTRHHRVHPRDGPALNGNVWWHGSVAQQHRHERAGTGRAPKKWRLEDTCEPLGRRKRISHPMTVLPQRSGPPPLGPWGKKTGDFELTVQPTQVQPKPSGGEGEKERRQEVPWWPKEGQDFGMQNSGPGTLSCLSRLSTGKPK